MEASSKLNISQKVKYLRLVEFISGGVGGVILLVLIIVGGITGNKIVTLILGILALMFIGLSAGSAYFYVKTIRQGVVKPLFERTAENMDKVSKNKYNLEQYPVDAPGGEFSQLNDAIAKINGKYNTIVMMSAVADMSEIGLEKDPSFGGKTIAKESFFASIPAMVNVSKSFRNAMVSFIYDTTEANPSHADMARLLDVINEVFADNAPVVSQDTDYSFIAFMSNIDSISIVESKLRYVVHKSTIARFGEKSTDVLPLKVSMSVYPYSSVETIVSDLRYAERRGQDINVYLPERSLDKDALVTEAQRINAVGEIIERMNTAFTKKGNVEAYREEVIACATSISDFLGFEGVAVLAKNSSTGEVSQIADHCTIEGKHIVLRNDGAAIIEELAKVADKDGSLTFFNRENITSNLGKYLDIYGIVSGHMSLVYSNGQVYAALIFVNFTKKLVLDAYSRESLVVFSNLFASSLKELHSRGTIEGSAAQLDSLLLYSAYQMYTINKNTYTLLSHSRGLCSATKGKDGEKCYKAIYGLDAPCADCPIRHGKKKRCVIDNKNYAYHTILSNRENKVDATLFLEPTDRRNLARERYDSETKLATPYSLAMRMADKWNYNLKGNLVLLNLANFRNMVSVLGEPVTNQFLRELGDVIASTGVTHDEVFSYNASTIAILLNEITRTDIFRSIEKVEKALKDKFNDEYQGFKIEKSYRVFSYPMTFASSFDFLRHVEVYFNSNNTRGDNQLHLIDANIVRPAYREAYIYSLLAKAFENKNFDIRIQPIVSKASGVINGGEVLLRLNDELTNSFFDAGEFIPIASKHSSMGRFTNIMIEQIGNLYKTYGATIFRSGFLDRISLNVDSIYFQNDQFLNDMQAAILEYNFAKGFINFELNEADIAANVEVIREASRKIRDLNISLVCDNYTGKDISIEQLAKLGFTEVKLARTLVMEIDSNPNRLNEVKSLIALAKTFNFKVTLVGIERREQVNVVFDEEGINNFEGWYFFKPLVIDEFLSLLKTASSKQAILK
ncbi:MAG: EAL domain-containing protein [Bacilli bacterium]|nr:EAL domain-containing protein [Bacilli bacterium]